jgi:L,D-transpeptidase ErfK/SrfK
MRYRHLPAFGLLALLGVAVGLRAAAEPLPENKQTLMVGTVQSFTTHYADTLLDIARANGLGYTELVAANPEVDPWLPGEGTPIVLPTGHLLPKAAHRGIVINLGDHRLYFFPADGTAPRSYAIGVGKEGWTTPLGHTSVVRKMRNPTWYPGPQVRAEKPELPSVVPPGPENPLGNHALYLGFEGYLLHGTNRPWGVGRRVSHGCIRLYPEGIADLFEQVPVGTPVEVVNQTVKLGWVQEVLYLEAHPEVVQIAALEESGTLAPPALGGIDLDTLERLRETAGPAFDSLDWAAIRDALRTRRGIPVPIGRLDPVAE